MIIKLLGHDKAGGAKSPRLSKRIRKARSFKIKGGRKMSGRAQSRFDIDGWNIEATAKDLAQRGGLAAADALEKLFRAETLPNGRYIGIGFDTGHLASNLVVRVGGDDKKAWAKVEPPNNRYRFVMREAKRGNEQFEHVGDVADATDAALDQYLEDTMDV